MRSSFAGIEIGRTGLTVSQLGLDVTGHNISNVDTLGYTRQRLITTAYEPNSTVGQFRPVNQALIGTGAVVKVLDQIRSSFLDRQYRTEQSLYSYWQSRTQGLTYVQSQFEGAEGATLNASIQAFFARLTTEAMDTDSRDPRVIVKQEAESLVFQFNMVYDRLIDMQQKQDLTVETVVGQINTIAENIAVLNKSIYTYELNMNQLANDLRDKRNLLLDELSSIIDIEYSTSEDGRLTVKIGDEVLVKHLDVRTLACRTDVNPIPEETYQVHIPYWTDTNGDLDFTNVKGGELKATIDLRDNGAGSLPGIPHYIEELNNLVRALVQEVNAIHRLGYTYPGAGDVSRTNVDFFHIDKVAGVDDLESITAKNFRLSQDIIDNVNNVASSSVLIDNDPNSSGYNPQMGNNENVRALAELIGKKDIGITIGGNNISIGGLDSFMTSIVVDMATTLKHSKTVLGTKNTQLLDVDNQRMSIAGVSLDEEMTNLIKYQHAYSGASRVITTMDEALDILINRMGRVGL